MGIMRIAWIGLGAMGYPMAGHLQQAGHEVCVYNRTIAKAHAWVDEYGGTMARTPAGAAVGAKMVITMVGNDDDVRSVIFGPGGVAESVTPLASSEVPIGQSTASVTAPRVADTRPDQPDTATIGPGVTIIDHTTASAGLARELGDRLGRIGVGFIDAPVSGGQAGAIDGVLTVMCGGEPEVIADAIPVMDSYAAAITHMGPVGAGQQTKMVNQIAIAGLLQGLSEAVHMAERSGLDPDLVLQAIAKGAAGSWQMSNRWSTMAAREFDFGFAVNWMRKDLGIALAEAERVAATLPVAALVNQFYGQLQTLGHGRSDTSSLVELLRRAGSHDESGAS